jgi:ParB family transcriptional regulator, chromosome partitioning protein
VTKDRRLGRGLAALLGTPAEDSVASETNEGGPVRAAARGEPAESRPQLRLHAASDEDSQTGEEPEDRLLHLRVDEIDDNPFQPRRDFRHQEIASLAESLKTHEMLQPILVRRIGDRYQLISGERRLRAAVHAGWSTVPARLREADDRLVAELAIVENLQRKDLNAVEKAMSFKRYLDQHACTQEDLARRLQIDRSTIANLIRLLELPETVLESLRSDTISAGHARALLPLGDEGRQIEFTRRIIEEGWTVRDAERLVAEHIAKEDGPPPAAPQATPRKRGKSDHVAALEQQLRMALGTKVEIRQTRSGRGRLVIHFTDHDEFERIMAHLEAG